MTYKAFLIKYAEIAIKGKNRYLFEDALVSQMNHALKKVDGTFHIRKEQGRIYAEMEGEYDYDGAVEALQHVFGIVGICPVVLLEDEGFDALAGEVIRYIDEVYPDKHFTFKVNARRARKNYPLESMEINAQMGERILEAFPETRVDVHKPQVMFNIVIRNQINVYSTVIPGPGRYAGRNKRKSHAALIRRNRQPGGRLHDCKARCYHRCDLFSCAALYVGARQAEGRGSGKDHFQIYRTDQSACGQFYGYSVIYLRTVPA